MRFRGFDIRPYIGKLASAVGILLMAILAFFQARSAAENQNVERLKFITTVVPNAENPCRITVVRKNHYETTSYAANIEGCKKS